MKHIILVWMTGSFFTCGFMLREPRWQQVHPAVRAAATVCLWPVILGYKLNERLEP